MLNISPARIFEAESALEKLLSCCSSKICLWAVSEANHAHPDCCTPSMYNPLFSCILYEFLLEKFIEGEERYRGSVRGDVGDVGLDISKCGGSEGPNKESGNVDVGKYLEDYEEVILKGNGSSTSNARTCDSSSHSGGNDQENDSDNGEDNGDDDDDDEDGDYDAGDGYAM